MYVGYVDTGVIRVVFAVTSPKQVQSSPNCSKNLDTDMLLSFLLEEGKERPRLVNF